MDCLYCFPWERLSINVVSLNHPDYVFIVSLECHCVAVVNIILEYHCTSLVPATGSWSGGVVWGQSLSVAASSVRVKTALRPTTLHHVVLLDIYCRALSLSYKTHSTTSTQTSLTNNISTQPGLDISPTNLWGNIKTNPSTHCLPLSLCVWSRLAGSL